MHDRFLEDLKNKVDIVEIVRRYAELKKSGKNFMCRSPFRNERTPSFCVSPDKQFWYDFGSSEGGDAISFIEKIENVSFAEAVDILANQAGVEVPRSFGEAKVSKTEKKDIFALHEKATEFFESQLEKSESAKNYLKDRKISDEVIKNWRLGYGGDASDGLTKFLLAGGFSQKQIAESGVAFEREFGNQTMRDRFSERLMIPICEAKNGQIVAFTGRDLSGKKDTAKYVNSPENPVYHKSSTLFGLDRGRRKIMERDAVILVEGNFDVISAHTAGFENAVATCGTSLTDDHLRVLKRLTRNIYLAFDSDIAGKKATLRAVEMILKMGLSPFVIEISGAKDLDELAQKSPELLGDAVKKARPALDFLFEKLAAKNLNGKIEGEKNFLDAFFFFLKLVSRPIEVDDFLNRIARKLNRPLTVIFEEFQRFNVSDAGYKKKKFDDTQMQKFSREEVFVGFLIAFWDFFGPKLNEKILGLFSDALPRDLLKKKMENADLSEEEKTKLAGWQMFIENQYGENTDEDILSKSFQVFLSEFQRKKDQAARIESAKGVREQLQ